MPAMLTIGNTTFDTPTDLDVVVTHVVQAPRKLVYETYTKPEHLRNWMLGPDGWTMTVCEVDYRPGGKYRFGWRKASGDTMEITGDVLEVVPLAKIVTTESWGGPWPDMVTTVAFVEQAGRTTITTTIHFPTKAARDAALDTGMNTGMATSYERLERYLATLA